MQSMQPFVLACLPTCPPGIASHWSMQLPTHKVVACNSIRTAEAAAEAEVAAVAATAVAVAAAANLYCVGGHAPHAAIIIAASFDLIGREFLECSDSL